MNVREREVASVLTRKVVSVVYNWAKENEQVLSPDKTPIDYKIKAQEYLESHNEFNSDELLNFVVYEEDSELRETQKNLLLETLEDTSIAGRTFEPQPDSLRRSEKKNIITTNQGVRITWDGTRQSKNIDIEDNGDGRKKITILTDEIKY